MYYVIYDMSTLYITKETKKRFENYIHESITNLKEYDSIELIIVKKNKKRKEYLFTYTCMSCDVINLICNYIDDILVFYCSITFDYNTMFTLNIEFIDVVIDFNTYGNYYEFNIMCSSNTRIRDRKYYEINLRNNDECVDIYETIRHNNRINGLISLFNSYMNHNYMFDKFHFDYDLLESYGYVKMDKNTLVRSMRNSYTVIKINNHKMLQQLIIILKLICNVMMTQFKQLNMTDIFNRIKVVEY